MSLCLLLEKNSGFYTLLPFGALGFRAFFTTRVHDMRFPESGGLGAARRKKAFKDLGVEAEDLVCPKQVHEDRVYIAGAKDRGRGVFNRNTAIPATDALITDRPEVTLCVMTADCLPVFIADRRQQAVAIIHAGWKSLHKGIILKTVRLMEETFSSDPGDLVAAFGPRIRSCCYEVGPEFLGHFKSGVARRGDKLCFELTDVAAAHLSEAGVSGNRVYDSRLCTSCLNDEFFSYRREGAATGHSMSVIRIGSPGTS